MGGGKSAARSGGESRLIEPSRFTPGLSDIVCNGCMWRQTLLPSALGHLGAMGSRLRQARTAVVHPTRDLQIEPRRVRNGAKPEGGDSKGERLLSAEADLYATAS